MATLPPKRTLETLPAEIRRHLLFALDLDSLRSLVYSSPIFHQQYLLDRRTILCQSLQSTLRSATPAACAVYRADVVGGLNHDDSAWSAAAATFLESWHRRAWSPGYSIGDENLTLDEAVAMAVFHRSVAKPVMAHASRWFLAKLEQETGTATDSELSRTEETRLLRGIYRLQLAAVVFGNGSQAEVPPPRDWGHFLTLSFADLIQPLEPWEIEEIACVFAFVGSVYNPVLDLVAKETDLEGPRFLSEARSANVNAAFDLRQDCAYNLVPYPFYVSLRPRPP